MAGARGSSVPSQPGCQVPGSAGWPSISQCLAALSKHKMKTHLGWPLQRSAVMFLEEYLDQSQESLSYHQCANYIFFLFKKIKFITVTLVNIGI